MKRRRELANVLHGIGIEVERKYLAPFAEQVDKIAAVTATSIEHTHARDNVPAQDLIEDVDIDLAELLLNGHKQTIFSSSHPRA
jgi:hypothetical protein